MASTAMASGNRQYALNVESVQRTTLRADGKAPQSRTGSRSSGIAVIILRKSVRVSGRKRRLNRNRQGSAWAGGDRMSPLQSGNRIQMPADGRCWLAREQPQVLKLYLSPSESWVRGTQASEGAGPSDPNCEKFLAYLSSRD